MSNVEKLRLMEDLWQDLAGGNSLIAPPAWHDEILLERERLTESGRETPVEWEEAKRRLREELL